MVIKSLKLRNYRRFRELDLELPENIIGIMGRNGAGKSTIVEAIGWILYGNRVVRTDRFDVRSLAAEERDVCTAEMVFVYGGQEYRIERRLKGKQAIIEAAVWRGGQGEPEAVQDRGVNEFIENLLQLDCQSFLASVFAQQKDLDKLSSLRPEERRQTISRLINIDRIDRAREQVRRDVNEKAAIAEGKRSLAKDPHELNSKKAELLQQKGQLASDLDACSASVRACEDVLAQSKQRFEAVSLKRDQYQQWQAQIGRLVSRQEEQIKNHNRAEQELQQVAAAEKELAQLRPELADWETVVSLKERLEEERQKAATLRGLFDKRGVLLATRQKEQAALAEAEARGREWTALNEEAQRLAAEEKALEEELTHWREREKAANAEKTAARRRGEELKGKLLKIQELGPEGECPVCTQRLGERFGDVVHNHEAQLEELRETYRRFQKEEEEAREKIAQMEEKLRQVRQAQQENARKEQSASEARRRTEECAGHLQQIDEQLRVVESEIASLGEVKFDEEEYQRVKERFEYLSDQSRKASRLEERASRRKEVEANLQAAAEALRSLAEEIAAANAAQAALGYDENDFLQKKEDVEQATRRLDAAREAANAVQVELAKLERDLQNLEQEIGAQEKLRAELAELEAEIASLKLLDELLGKFRLDLAGRVRPLIARRASELLALTTHGRYSQIDLDEDYAIRIYDGNQAFPIKRFSGGEEDLVNLCLRIAVSQVVAERVGGAPINFIVLDEIFGSQDSERRNLILEALNRLSAQFRQIFIITHIETIRDMLPVLIDVEPIDESTSRARLV
ncbi:MAG: SMC family ATPase [candidate division KSB1 bacterium]|nr:SMC family ATPase [candidate division KSB1 bacterium]